MRGGLGLSAGIVLLLLASLLSGSLVQAGTGPEAEAERGWTTYRGDPGRTGVRGTTGEDLGGPSWTYDIGPIAGTGPIIVDDVLYIGGSAGPEDYPPGNVTKTEYECPSNGTAPCISAVVGAEPPLVAPVPIYAIDAATGRVLWEQAIPGSIEPVGARVHGTPSYADGKLFVGSTSGPMFALNASTGEILWRENTGPHLGRGIAASPAVDQGRVFVGTGGPRSSAAMAFDAETGERLWVHNETGISIWNSPTVHQDTVYFGAYTSSRGGVAQLLALDIETGDERWSFEHPGSSHVTPLPAGDRVIFGSEDGRVYAVGERTGAFAWATTVEDTRNRNEGVSTPPAGDWRHVFVGTGDYELVALEPKTGEVLWRYKADDPLHAGPVLDRGKVYIGSWDDRLHVVNATTGELAWSYSVDGEMSGATPAVVDGRVFLVTKDGTLTAIHEASADVEVPSSIPMPGLVPLAMVLVVLTALPHRRRGA